MKSKLPRLKRSSSAWRPKTGIVHLGLGAFFRGFGCVFVADAMASSGGDWGIIGVSLRSPDTRDALQDQDWAYTSVTLAEDGEKTSLIEVLNDVLVAPEDPAKVLSMMADSGVKIVSLTVTEKGYYYSPATGKLNLDHCDIQHDLVQEYPKTALGYIVRALQMRRALGMPPFTVLCCDNLPSNGKLVGRIVVELAALIDPELAEWISNECCFPSTMVDRITPATTEADITRVAEITGRYDAAPVMHEAFYQWAIEDHFVGNNRPDFAAVRVEMVEDVTAHEHMKLRMLNGTHSALAYTGYLAGHEAISDTVADPVFANYVRQLWSEIIPTVVAPEGINLSDYADALFSRYKNPAIRHRTWQIAMDGSQKLPQRILGTVRENMEAGRNTPALYLAIAAWMRYVTGSDEADNPIDVRDPLAARLKEISMSASDLDGLVEGYLEMAEIFPSDIAQNLKVPVTQAAHLIWNIGAREAVRRIVT